MKETYRFVGAMSAVGNVELKRFGQTIELTKEEAANAILGGCAIIPESEFQSLGFHPQEVGITAGQQIGKPSEFRAKKAAAHDKFRAILAGIGQIAEEVLTAAATVALNAGEIAVEKKLGVK